MIRPTLILALGAALAALGLPSREADGGRPEAVVKLKNDGHRDTMRCTLYHVAHWSNRRKKAIEHFRVSPRDTETHSVTLPNRPIPKRRKVRPMPNPNYRPKLQLFCRLGKNKNMWEWGPIWDTEEKPVDEWRQESICRSGSPCGVFFEEQESL